MSSAKPPLESLIVVLRRSGEEPDSVSVAEALWLAWRVPESTAQQQSEEKQTPSPPPSAPPPPRPSVPPDRGETLGQTGGDARAQQISGVAGAELYPVQAGATGPGAAGRSIRSPGATALPGGLEIGRSLRPLKRRVPSPNRLMLDEARTAHRIADTDDWMPVFRPAPERWLNIVLLVDESASMPIWLKTVAELRGLLEAQGAFRVISVLGFRATTGDGDIEIYSPNDRRRTRRPKELLDPARRTLVAVASDCVSRVWHNGVMAGLLAAWGKAGLATILQMLPERLWVRTGLRTFPSVYMRSPEAGAANGEYEIEWTNYTPEKPKGVAIPVAPLEAPALSYWSRAVAGNSNLWIPGVYASARAQTAVAQRAPTKARASETADAERLVKVFYGTASPTARQLASYLAAVPLTLPVMRLVQRALLPESRQVHLAEVWLSGLIDRPETDKPEQAEYKLVNGVRELLLNNLRLGTALDVLRTVSGYVGERMGDPLDFEALLRDPQATGSVKIAEGYEPFARVAAVALRRFGGRYAEIAERLGSTVGVAPPVAQAATEVQVGARRRRERPWKRRAEFAVRALVVGVDRYAHTGIPDLQGAVNDAQATTQWLRQTPYDASIKQLQDDAATKRAIVSAWREITAQTKEGDQFYFHFSGNDQQVASNDPNEADGLEEALLAHDSIPGERDTLLTHSELADLAEEIESRGGQCVLVLDSCRMASGIFARRALTDTLVFAATAEAELSREILVNDQERGAVSHFLAQVMQTHNASRTWLAIFEQVVARIAQLGLAQTPQLIGQGEMAVFRGDRETEPPHLFVARFEGSEVIIGAPDALRLGPGARFAVFPPGSNLEGPSFGVCRAVRSVTGGVAATAETPFRIPQAARVRILDFGDAEPVCRVGVPAELLERMPPMPGVAVQSGTENADYEVAEEDGSYVIRSPEGRVLWEEPAEADTSPEEKLARVAETLGRMAGYIRAFRLENQARSALSGKVELTVAGTASATVELDENEPVTVRLRSRATVNLYVSVWMFDQYLGVERIFPANTACLLLGAGREVQLAVTLRSEGRVRFKVFASTDPQDLSVLAQPPLSAPMDLDVEPRRVRSERPAADWIAGGPVAVPSKLWTPGILLRVRFLDGDPALRKRVREFATEWTRYANVRFEFVESGDAELRVTFLSGGNAWSYLGTDALHIGKEEATINLSALTPGSSDEEVRMTTLHEFGHALGLAAAQMSPVARIPWNRRRAYAYYRRSGWAKETVDSQVLRQLDASEARYGPADADSVMYHPIPKEATDGVREIRPGKVLSEADKKFIAELYPRGAADQR